MSATDRQHRLLVAEDWKRIYQSYQHANFQSYDFDNLRRVMISYIRENYPEDFNDYIESSEYLALIDLMAFLGQSISFRIDLNARDNFLELAERRESVLRQARLLSYKVSRNVPASGLLKFTSISTSQAVYDSNGRNLAGQVVSWNDPANSNWYDQFIKVLNAAMPTTRQFGSSTINTSVYGIPTESYRFQASNVDVPIYGFTKAVDGRNMTFEIVSTAISDLMEIVEEAPRAGNKLSFIYRDDGKGNSSSNTGFFIMFKEGSLNQGVFTLTQASPDETVDIDAERINDTDVWLYQLDSTGNESDLWTQVPNLEGNNIIYNSLMKTVRNIYGVITRTNDKVSLVFSDGVFGDIPQGTFRVYYRTSNGLSYTINPKDIRNVSIDIPYISNLNQQETLTISLSLQSSVANSAPSESSESIKAKAPATFYTQNRMITAEDYNISPLSVNQEVVKVKAVNRSSSGISRHFDLLDPTGKYSKTTLFADDGVIYKRLFTDAFRFKYATRTDIESVIYNQVVPVLKSDYLRNFYYSNFTKTTLDDSWAWYNQHPTRTNQSVGNIIKDGEPHPVGAGDLSNFTIGALVKFKAPAGYHFDKSNNNNLVPTDVELWTLKNVATEVWTSVVSAPSGLSPIVLNDSIPDSAILSRITPSWRSTLTPTVVASMIDLIFANKPFGLRYDVLTRTWQIITETNLNIGDVFNPEANTTDQKLDSSWLLMFTTDTEFYTVKSRLCQYIFESAQQVRFLFNSKDKIYDAKSNNVINDTIRVLSINPNSNNVPYTYDLDWQIVEEYIGLDGCVDTRKVAVSFNDSDSDGIVDDPTLFETIVGPSASYIVLERYSIARGQEDYRYIPNDPNIGPVIIVQPQDTPAIENGKYYYFVDKGVVKKGGVDGLTPTLDYKVFVGRDKIKFQYIHNAGYESRIDPGLTNLVDVYVLTRQYDTKYRQWLLGQLDEEPLPPSTDFLFNMLAPDLNKIKSLSDEVIYHPVKYKVLFGKTATSDVRATFKVVKNSEVVISDNEVKTRVLNAITEFFALENWDFGDSFYFSELSTYVMTKLSPNIVNFTIVPSYAEMAFGSLYEIRSEPDQIFINGATIDDIEIITNITASAIKSASAVDFGQSVVVQQSITSSGSI